MDNLDRKLVNKVKAGARRLRKDADSVKTSADFVRFIARIQRWHSGGAMIADEIIGDSEWSSRAEAEIRAAAQASMERAEADRRWKHECAMLRIDAEEAASRRRPLDAAERQYQKEMRVYLART